MSKLTYFLCFITCAYFSTLFFDTSLRNYRIKKFGEEKFCTVLNRGECGKSGGTIKVSLHEKEYNLSIGRVDCIEGNYSIGSQVKNLYGRDYDYMILPEDKAELGFYLSLLFFILPLYFLYQLIKPLRKSKNVAVSNKKKANKK